VQKIGTKIPERGANKLRAYAYYLGLDIGGTKCAVLLGRAEAGRDLTLCERVVFPTEGTPLQVIHNACAIMDDMLRKAAVLPVQVTGIGISCGGPLDSKSGRILSPPNLPGWDDVPISEILRARYPVWIRLENDANACTVAEWKFGAARGFRNIVFLTFGTGLGAGLILDGRLYRGTNDMAGEVGHVRLSEFGPVGYGKAGSFEGFCSGGGIAQLARQMALERIQRGERPALCPDISGLSALTAKSVGAAADAGDPLARAIYAVSGKYLGRGIAMLVDILNPEIIVIGSVFQRSGHLLAEHMERALTQESLALSRGVCRVVPAGLGDSIGDYAALSLALPDDSGSCV
jgi:glucokinase